MRIDGSCHCGNIIFALDWEPSPSAIPARACGCSFCTKHGGVWTSNPKGSLRIRIQDAASVSNYQFGTRTAKFHICTRCGIVPFVTSEIDGRLYAVVSVNAFEGIDASRLRKSAANFDGEGTGDRLARRTRGWIPEVRLEIAS